MTNNAATLVWHVGKTLNQKAGKLDAKLYGTMVEKPKPEHKPTEDLPLYARVGLGTLGLVVLIAWIVSLQNNVDRVKRRVMR